MAGEEKGSHKAPKEEMERCTSSRVGQDMTEGGLVGWTRGEKCQAGSCE